LPTDLIYKNTFIYSFVFGMNPTDPHSLSGFVV
jgi:hypothetical protein